MLLNIIAITAISTMAIDWTAIKVKKTANKRDEKINDITHELEEMAKRLESH